MAVTAHVYNHYAKEIAAGAIDQENRKLMFLDADAATLFNATHTSVDQVAGALAGEPEEREHEVYGNGWPQGGPAVAEIAATTINTNGAAVSGAQTVEDATGGSIGPGRSILDYDATSGKPFVFYDLGQDEYAGDSTPFKLTFDLDGTPGRMIELLVVEE
ncbi:hypothetical protein [Nitrobacter winogradskyi]|uniref:Uncharacterized protein n=2 Tax=Nitrobacter winogradskyi TaxID=913 RepID=A0ACC6AGE1_NITWI|nr:hypothetical protein [Nitrobacter winogradskyi]MCP1998769.1 hypothetical protein [Nitrobacter winogradskyi]GEC14306.1 hypothetical protein NWI01_01980 [Nitrobacter winogradskyi]